MKAAPFKGVDIPWGIEERPDPVLGPGEMAARERFSEPRFVEGEFAELVNRLSRK